MVMKEGLGQKVSENEDQDDFEGGSVEVKTLDLIEALWC